MRLFSNRIQGVPFGSKKRWCANIVDHTFFHNQKLTHMQKEWIMGFWRSSHTAESSWTWISPLLFSLKFCQFQAPHASFGEEVLCLDFWFHLHQGQFLQRVNNDRAIHSQCAVLLCKIGQPFPFVIARFVIFIWGYQSHQVPVVASLSFNTDVLLYSRKMDRKRLILGYVVLFLNFQIGNARSDHHRIKRQIEFGANVDEFLGRSLFRPFSNGNSDSILDIILKRCYNFICHTKRGIYCEPNRIRHTFYNQCTTWCGKQVPRY